MQGESHIGYTHLKVEVEKAQLEVELVTPKWYDYCDLGCYALVVSKRILQENIKHSGVCRMYGVTCGIKRPRVIESKGVFKKTGEFSWLKRVWCRTVELP